MYDIPFHINLFISLTELKPPLKTSIKEFFPLFISLIEVEHPLKTANKTTAFPIYYFN